MLRSILSTALFATTLSIGSIAAAHAETRTIVLAGGCFWCVESDFDHVEGVLSTTSGFAGGTLENPTYRNHGKHREVVKVEYDSLVTDYKTLVTTFLRTIDPTDDGGQFCDRGHAYSPALFAANDDEKAIAQEALEEASRQLGQDLPVPISTIFNFGAIDAYHLDYYKSTDTVLTRYGLIEKKDAYKKYRKACGRDARVKAVWGTQAYKGVMQHGS